MCNSHTALQASAGLHASYLLRSDGVVDRIRGGAVESELRCGGGACYIELVDQTEVQTDKSNNPSLYFYIIRSDGMADRYKTYFGTLTKEMHPPVGETFVAGAAGLHQSYLLCSGGAAERIRSGKVTQQLRPSPGPAVRYIGGSCGGWSSYLLRDDGVVDRTQHGGRISHEMVPSSPEQTQRTCIIS